MSKREDIERALGPIIGQALFEGGLLEGEDILDTIESIVDRLAESKDVIVIECEVGRFEGAEYMGMPKRKQTEIMVHSGGYSSALYLDGYIGAPGKATCIILPRKEAK